jgi:hypothetical protein
MTLSTLPRFLIGQRQAIVEVVNCRSSLWLSALFVLSAGFAREYNQEDLLHDPWYVLIPMAASLATSFVLHGIIYLAANCDNAKLQSTLFKSYFRFLSLYWMTAPLAWLYALPVEHYLSAAGSVRVNLSLLGVVSVWRVLLITRCASVLFGSSYVATFFLVMFFADSLALGILFFTPLPIFNVMGGIPHTESESVILDAALSVGFIGGVTWLIWLIGFFAVLTHNKAWTPLEVSTDNSAKVSKPLWGLAVLSLVVWVGAIPQTQPAQQLRRQAESDLLNGRVAEGLKLMSSHKLGDFPPHWDPPPWQGYGQDEPPLTSLILMFDDTTANWVAHTYFEKLNRRIGNPTLSSHYFWDSMKDDEFAAYIAIFENTSQGAEILRDNGFDIKVAISDLPKDQNDRKEQFRAVLDKLDIEIEERKNR